MQEHQTSDLFHYVYLTTNLITKQQYVGDRSTFIEPEKDKYLGSGRDIRIAITEYGRKNFSKIVLEKCNTRKEAGDKQGFYIKLYKTHISQGGYNVSWDGGTCCGDRTHSEETKQLMRDKAKLRKPQSEETKLKRSNSLKGHIVSEESIKKRNETRSKRTYIVSEETREKHRKNKLNMSPETKNKIKINTKLAMQRPGVKEKQRKALLGRIPWNKGKRGLQTSPNKGKTYEEIYGEEKGEAIRKQMSESQKGKKQSKETIKKRSESMKGKNKGKISQKRGLKMDKDFSDKVKRGIKEKRNKK